MAKKTQEELNNQYAHTLARIGEKMAHKRQLDNELKKLYEEVDKIQLEAAYLAKKPGVESKEDTPPTELPSTEAV